MNTFTARIVGGLIGAAILLALVFFAPAGAEEKVVSAGEVAVTIDSLRKAAKAKEGCKEPIAEAHSVGRGHNNIRVVVTCPNAGDKRKNSESEKRKER